MNQTDKNIIIRKIKFIQEDLPRLKKTAKLSEKQYLSDITTQLATERLLERIITRLIDINYHLLKTKFYVLPKDYTDSFKKLLDKKVITKPMYQNIAPSAGLRNHLAHEYDEIDPKQIYQGVKNLLKHISGYLKQITIFT